ncbi:hypothetical protein ACFWA5_18605 [Streptomyces mirabilis]|uniref:hypothetical protein n=1 Tax=Streptomyces mirabilis TaxID=68239 RepID=UPI00364E7B9B
MAHAVREPLLERVTLSEEFFAPLMAATVYDPDPSFCRWFIDPALYAFGRRRVTAALLNHARTGTDAGTTAGWLRRQCRDGLRRIRSTTALLASFVPDLKEALASIDRRGDVLMDGPMALIRTRHSAADRCTKATQDVTGCIRGARFHAD